MASTATRDEAATGTGGDLSAWNDTPTKRTIVEFVERVTTEGGPNYVPPQERVATYDNDGTLWCEKPAPIETGFLLARLAEMAQRDADLRERQPWKAAYERDFGWLGSAINKHYAGDDADMQLLIDGMVKAFAGESVDRYSAAAHAYLSETPHPTLGRELHRCGYAPMVDLMRYLERHGFVNYIASGGDRDFMRPITDEIFGIPPERVIGSSNALGWADDEDGGTVVYRDRPDFFDDGPVKPVRIWSRIGRRPILAVGNSNGDIPMLRYAGGQGRPALRVLLLHDDADREFDYTTGAEDALETAARDQWTVVSIKRDWATVFAP